jgi:hypothetical protein
MPRTVTVSWTCDECDAELDEATALVAELPLRPGASRRLVIGDHGLEPSACEGVYCSFRCLRAGVDKLAAAAA